MIEISDKNSYAVFECIRENGPIYKREVQAITHLSWGSISNITSKLLEAGIISEEKDDTELLGRKPFLYDINKTDNLVIGVDVCINTITGSVVTLKGERIFLESIELVSDDSILIMHQLFLVIRKLFQDVGDVSKIKYIGLAFPGIIINDNEELHFMHYFTNLFPKDILHKISKEFSVPVKAFHDPECLLSNYLSLNHQERGKDVMLIRWSHGIGMALTVNGEIYRGGNQSAGEIGHVMVSADGPLCSCGKMGCLEAFSSVQTLLKKTRIGVGLGLCKSLDSFANRLEQITFANMMDAYAGGDVYIHNIVDEAVAHMSMVIANTLNIIDPHIVILSGEFTRAEKQCIVKLEDTINQRTWRRENIKLRTDTAAQVDIGAAQMLTKAVYIREFEQKYLNTSNKQVKAIK